MTTVNNACIPVEFQLIDGNRAFSLHAKDNPALGWDGLGGSVELNGRLVSVSETTDPELIVVGDSMYILSCPLPECGLHWQWELVVGAAGLEVTARLRNTGNAPLTIGPWHMLQLTNGGAIRLGADPAGATFFCWSPWDMRVERLGSGDGRHASDNLCHLHAPATGATLLCGFTTLDRMHGRHTLRCNAEGITEYRATCTFGEYQLQPGQELVAERLSLSLHADPYAALEAWADQINRTYRPVFADLPPVGWCGWAWADAFAGREGNWESVAVANARAIREKLQGFDVRYVWTSQANLKNEIPGNWLATDERNIPSGLPGFFRQLQELDFLPGLWVAPYWFYREAEGMLEENEANLLRDADGNPICEEGSFGWQYDDDLSWYHLHKYYLDGTHPGSADFLRKVFGYYRELGVRYYMLDFLGIANGRLHDRTKTPLQAGADMLRVIRETAGPETHIQTAVSSTPAYVGLIDAARVGRDFGEGRPLQGTPLSDWRNATYVLHDLHYANTLALLQNVAANYFTHRRLFMNDFNLLTIDKPVPLEHARIAVTVFGLGGGSPLMLGDDYRRIAPERLRMVKLCLPRTRDSVRPADLFERVHPDDYCRVLTLPVRTEWDNYLLAAVFNMDDEPFSTELDFAKLGLDADAPYRVFEFWNEEYVGTYTRRVACTIPPGTCRLFRLAPARTHPWLLGTDLHTQQGAVEIKRLAWDAERMRLSGSVSRPTGESGNLFFLMPRKMRLLNHEGINQLKELLDLNVILRLPVQFSEETAEFELCFEPWELGLVAPVGLLPYATEQEWREYMRRTGKDDTRVYE
ncbi:MAG: hypothetical protein ACYDCO_23045 [Armatimonadota bacterium]